MTFMTLAQARENFFAAMQTLRSSKVRSALTVLGIVIGVSSVISMAAIIQGLNKFVQDRVESLGSRTYFLTRFPPGTDPSRMPQRIRIRRYFEYDYAEFIRAAAPDVENVTTVGTRGFFFGDSNLITSGDHSVEKVIVRGAEPEYTVALPLFNIERGRFITAFDQEHARPVVVLGAAISESLFPNTDALGKTVRINGAAYEVIGVFTHDQGLFLGPGVDIFAIIPLSNFKRQYPEAKELIMLFTAPKDVNVETAQGEVIQAMRRLRRIPAGKENHRSDEYHAHFRDGAHPRNWGAQSHRCSESRCTAAIPAGGRGVDSGRRHDRHSDRGRHIRIGTHTGAVDSRDPVLSMGVDRLRDLRGRGLVLRLLSGKHRGQPRPHRLPAVRVTISTFTTQVLKWVRHQASPKTIAAPNSASQKSPLTLFIPTSLDCTSNELYSSDS